MCDTLGKIGNKKRYSMFAKNSDRQYDEPQIMVFYVLPAFAQKNNSINQLLKLV